MASDKTVVVNSQRPLRWFMIAAVLCLVGAACTGGSEQTLDTTVPEAAEELTDRNGGEPETLGFEEQATVIIANSPGAITTSGNQRVLTALIGEGPNNFLGGPGQPVTIRFDAVNTPDTGEVPGEFLTTNASALGLYVSYFEFASPGLWEITVVSDGVDVGTALFEITERSPIPNIGDPAPATDSLTGTTADEIAAISTDPDPIPGYYDLSVSEAIANDRPTVIAFVTPAFCQTALCGSTLETVKEVTAGRDDLDVIHVEPFDLELAPVGTLLPIPSMDDWGLQTEPWVFVVDAEGTVAASFEGIIGLGELEDALVDL